MDNLSQTTFKTIRDLRKHLVNNDTVYFPDESIDDRDYEIIIDNQIDELLKNNQVIILELEEE